MLLKRGPHLKNISCNVTMSAILVSSKENVNPIERSITKKFNGLKLCASEWYPGMKCSNRKMDSSKTILSHWKLRSNQTNQKAMFQMSIQTTQPNAVDSHVQFVWKAWTVKIYRIHHAAICFAPHALLQLSGIAMLVHYARQRSNWMIYGAFIHMRSFVLHFNH